MPRTLSITIEAVCANDAQHLAVSGMLKTIVQILDMAVEARHPGNDFTFKIVGDHPDSVTSIPSPEAIDHAMSLGEIRKV